MIQHTHSNANDNHVPGNAELVTEHHVCL